MNILPIDDHANSRLGIAEMLRQMFPEVSVYEANNFDDGMGIVRTTPLNLVFLDVHMPSKGGLDGLGELKMEFPICVS